VFRQDRRLFSRSLGLLAGLVLFSSSPVLAVPTGPPVAEQRPPNSIRLSLTDALSLFLQQNLDVLISKYGIEYSKGQQITARLFPNPVMSIGNLASFTQGHTAGNSG